jgi:hypothetical protein
VAQFRAVCLDVDDAMLRALKATMNSISHGIPLCQLRHAASLAGGWLAPPKGLRELLAAMIRLVPSRSAAPVVLHWWKALSRPN